MLIKECYGAKETKEMNGPKDTNDDETPSKLKRSTSVQVSVISPADPEQRGCQLSLRFSIPVKKVIEEIEKRGVVVSVKCFEMYIFYVFQMFSVLQTFEMLL